MKKLKFKIDRNLINKLAERSEDYPDLTLIAEDRKEAFNFRAQLDEEKEKRLIEFASVIADKKYNSIDEIHKEHHHKTGKYLQIGKEDYDSCEEMIDIVHPYRGEAEIIWMLLLEVSWSYNKILEFHNSYRRDVIGYLEEAIGDIKKAEFDLEEGYEIEIDKNCRKNY